MNAQPTCYQGELADGRQVDVEVTDGLITGVRDIAAKRDLPSFFPILVDLQHNGALGCAYGAMAEDDHHRLHETATLLRRHGVGRCLPTLVSESEPAVLKAVSCLDMWLAADADLSLLFAGILHEGGNISPEDGWRGVHPREHIYPPDWDRVARLDEKSGGRIRLVNVAPEEPGGLEFVKRAVGAGKLVALGHCNPNAATVHAATAAGASLVTHFGNGARGVVPRFDNPFWAMLNEPGLTFSLIGDGFHIPADLAGVVRRCKGADGYYMVSDAGHLSGCPPGHYEAYGEECVVETNGHLHVAGESRLAAAWFQLDRSVEWLVETQGLLLREAWRQCSEVPARILGLDLPQIEVGAEASFVLAHWDCGLVIDQSVHRGRAYLDAPIRPTDCSLTG